MFNLCLGPYSEFLFLVLKFLLDLFYGFWLYNFHLTFFQFSDKTLHFAFYFLRYIKDNYFIVLIGHFHFLEFCELFLFSTVSADFSTCCHVFSYACFVLCTQYWICFVYRSSLKPRMMLSFYTHTQMIFALSRHLQVLAIQFQGLKCLEGELQSL